jgi:hypothetical protein
MEKIGLIAGNRRFPIIVSQGAKRKGVWVVCVAVRGETSTEIKRYVDKTHWLSLSEFGRLFEIFKDEGVKKIIMAGQISPWRLFSQEVKKSKEIQELLVSIKDRKANTIFSALAKKLEAQGLELINSTTFIEDFLVQKGILTKREPSPSEWEEIYFALDLAKVVAGLDIGLTVAVKNKAVVAVEALEGTDNLIRRAARLANEGVVVVKVGRPNQDMRFDIPVVGLNTVKNLIKARATSLAIEAGKTLFIDMQASIKLAEKRGIAIAAV